MTRLTIDQLVNDLFDFATARAEGFTRSEACDHIGLSAAQFRKGINHLRQILASDTIALPCVPAGPGEEWRYQLVGTLEGCRPWTVNRIADARARVRTMTAMLQPIVAGTDGRTREGKQAREMHMTFKHLMERLDLLDEEVTA